MLRTVFARRCSPLMLWAGLCLAAPAAWSQMSVPAGDAAQARDWLLRIHSAASHRNFQGTFVVSGGGTVSSARIAHFCEGPNQLERSEALDGQARLVYRHNEVVTTLWPSHKVAMVEQRSLITEFPGLLQLGDDRIGEFYEMRAQGVERVAGHEANVLLVKPRDAARYGYRLWADQASGLLLRADVLGDHNEVLESSAFSDVAINVKPAPESVLLPMKHLEGYRVIRPVMVPTSFESQGWVMRDSAPGFRQVSCVKRPMENSAAADDAENLQVLQAIFSDGLTYVSLFIEPFDAKRHTRPMLVAVGPTQTLTRRQGAWWVTLVGDVPAATLKQFAQGLERVDK